MPKKSESKAPTITEKLAQLDQQIEWFYSDDFQLDEAVKKYQEANQLAKEIDQSLAELKNQVEVIEDFTKS